MEIVAEQLREKNDNPRHKSHKQKKLYRLHLKRHCLQEAHIGTKMDLSPQITTRVSLRFPLLCASHQSLTSTLYLECTQEMNSGAGVLGGAPT